MNGMNDMNSLSTDWASLWQQAHFLRPEWLWALLAIPAVVLLLRHQGQRDSGWQQHIDPELLKHLGQGTQGQHSKSRLWAWLLATVLAVIGLAGPSWQQLPQPVIKHTDATVVVLDLSLSMLAEDAKPSRLQQARYKIADILQQRREGETALLVFAGDAFVVAPLTTDTATLQNLLPTLSPQMMPSSGSNPTAATRRAIELIRDGGHQRGHIVLISDGITASQSQAMAKLLRASGDSLAVIAVGSADGAPIPAEGGGFYKDQAGNILVPKLNAQPLKQLASKVGGRYTLLDLSAQDAERLSKGQWQQRQDSEQEASSREFDQWQDSGYWLAIALIPFALLLFRRGAVLGLCIAFLPLLNTQEAHAQSLQWQNLWQTPDQQGEAAMQSGNHGAAMQLFEDPAWRGAAAYRAGDYATAAMAYSELDTADAHYNRGNALLKQGQLDEAITAYNSALAQEPQREDAQANLAIAEALKQAQEQQEQQNQPGQNGGGQNSEQQAPEQQDSQQQDSEQQNSDEQGSEDQSTENQGSENQESENQEQQNQQGQNSEQADKPQDSSSADNQNQSDEQQNQSQGENQKQLDQQLAQQAAEDAQQQNQEQNDQQSEQQGEQQEAGLAQAQQQAAGEEAQSEEEARAAALQASGVPDEEAQALEQWLRKIPDDPSGLLRNKFKYQHYQRQQSAREHQDEIAPY